MDMIVGFWTAVVAGAGLLWWWWNEYRYALRRVSGGAKLPPGCMGIPFLGETMLAFLWYFKVLRRPDDFINSKRRKYGDGVGLYKTHLFGSPTIIACTPSANKFFLQSNSSFLMKWNSDELVGETSLVNVEGNAHTRVRSLLTRSINQPDALRKINVMIQPRVMAFLKSWSKKGRITLFKEAQKLVFANTGKYFASIETDHALDTLNGLFVGVVGGLRAYPLNFLGTAFRYALQCRRKAMAILREELEERKKCGASSEPKNDLMESLMQMKDEEGTGLTDMEVLDNIVSLVVVGYMSTSMAITWALYYLAKYPDVLLKLREEHMPISKKLNGDLITYDELASCKYLSKVVDEVLRMANLAAFTLRTTMKDVEYKGYKIPKDWKVACWFRYLHTNPEYFEDPLCFNPDRWNEAPSPGSYLVFGGGPRICPGNMFARLQISIVLHHLVVGYRGELVNPNVGITYLPNPKPDDEVEIYISQI